MIKFGFKMVISEKKHDDSNETLGCRNETAVGTLRFVRAIFNFRAIFDTRLESE